MQSKDLRIGNYIFDSAKNIHRITSINDLELGLVGCSIEFRFAEPIKLTEKLLLNLGAKKFDGNFLHDRFRLFPCSQYGYYYIVDKETNSYFSKVEFLHEYQNFYFANNGIEIELKHESKP